MITIIDNCNGINPQVNAGDCYKFLYDISTRSGDIHRAGSTLKVIDFTTKTPYLEISASGRNWVCETIYGTSIWATLEQCISRGIIVKV